MKKQLFLTTAMAAAIAGLPACSSNNGWDDEVVADRDTAVCVDRNGERVDDDLCDDDRGSYGGSNAFLWYYLGRMSAVPFYGESIHHRRYASSGSFYPEPGVSYSRAPASTRMTRSQAVSRGGLGSRGRFFGGGRS